MMIRTFFFFFFFFGRAMTGLWDWAMLGRQSAMGATSLPRVLSFTTSKSSLKVCLSFETTVCLLEAMAATGAGGSGLHL